MKVKINREIRDYTESVFFGLSLRLPAHEPEKAAHCTRCSRSASSLERF
jgi:hypothetical protein